MAKNDTASKLDAIMTALNATTGAIGTIAENMTALTARVATLETVAVSPKASAAPDPQNAQNPGPAKNRAESTVKGKVSKIAASHKGMQLDGHDGWFNVHKDSAPLFTSDRVALGKTVTLTTDKDGHVISMHVGGKTGATYAVESRPTPTEETVKGTLSKVHRGGMACWLKETGETYYNATKASGALFQSLETGTRIAITILADGSPNPKATAVSIISKDAPRQNRVQNAPSKSETVKTVATPETATKSLTVSLVADSDAGCAHCGAKHGKNGKGIVILECSIRQYMKDTGEKLNPADDASMMAYMDWRMTRILEVSVNAEDSLIIKGSKYVAPTAEKPAKRGPGRPKGSKNASKGTDPKASRQ